MKNALREEENAELIHFICQKLKYVKSPQSIYKLCQQFKTETVSSRNVESLAHFVRNWKERIHLLEEYDLDTRARMIFALGVDINVHFLAEIRRFAHVALDEKGRITSYKKKNGKLEFGTQQSPIGAPKPLMNPVNNKETAQLIQFVLQKTKDVVTQRSVHWICRDFKHKMKSIHSIATLYTKVYQWRQKIHESNEFDMDTKVRLLFVLNGKIDDGFLAEMVKNADVELDREGKIARYKKHGEEWEFKKKEGLKVELQPPPIPMSLRVKREEDKQKYPPPIIVKEEREVEFQPPSIPINLKVKREEESPEDEESEMIDVETVEESKPEIRKSSRVSKKRELSIMPIIRPSPYSPKVPKPKSPKLPLSVVNVKKEFKSPVKKGTSSSDDSYTYTNADGSGPSTSGSPSMMSPSGKPVNSVPDTIPDVNLSVSDGIKSTSRPALRTKFSPMNLKKSPNSPTIKIPTPKSPKRLPPVNVKNEFKSPAKKVENQERKRSSSSDSNAKESESSTSGSLVDQKKRRLNSLPEIDSGVDLSVSDVKKTPKVKNQPAWLDDLYQNIGGVPFVCDESVRSARESENDKEPKERTEMTRVYSEESSTSVKWYLCVLRAFIVALNHPIFNELHAEIEFLIKKMSVKDEKLPLFALLLNLESLLMVTTKNARFYQHPDTDWKSLRDFASMLQLAAGTVNHPIMDPFLKKLSVIIEELTKDTDKKISMEKLNTAFKISIDMLNA
ncbi:hypothetical protein GCK72_000028 [Caenorhabditis remanei]|uniref:SPK domain-containing protein n=1 Tax=Caenorhabditis remanei TaxID=31234 RepID=A0A6A5HNJ4_CAERE|nr:hypothetical protein GCK72_000028 [Caenorhabditis remanei]KAF1768216.1 hypothetical protein GCK72_000028 [Caenorhabditis remanei]